MRNPRFSVNFPKFQSILTFASRFAWVLVDNRDNRVSWVRDNGAEDTSNVTSSEGNHQLFGLGALVTWLWNNIVVKGDNSFFEASELHHCVWDLSHPKWFQSLEECSSSFFGLHLWETFTEG